MTLVHNGRIIVIVFQTGWKHRFDSLGRCAHEFLGFFLRHKGIVRCQTDLSGIQRLARHDTAGGLLHIRRPAKYNWALAAKFQRQWHEIVRRRAHDVVRNGGRAGEDHVVESELGKFRANFRPTGYDRNFLLIVILRKERLHQFRGRLSEL